MPYYHQNVAIFSLVSALFKRLSKTALTSQAISIIILKWLLFLGI